MSVIEVDALNSEKMFKLMFNQLSNSNSTVSKEALKKNLSQEEMKKIVSQEVPDIDEVIKDLNRIANSNILNKKVKLSVNKELNRVIIKIVDKDTDRVIKEIPCKELQQLAMHLKKAIGILFDENA
ncbi:flagellar protein FlaG [Candidatus Bathyarchaeota archaeon]|nr:flagellar protein FlaG [Candidatus Bathyarchaeota archaeon]